ncbi:hypothetical protein AURDEDRAFT_178786 [Auricularia subglabra TFB-10046 SS5]|uniref:Uncharacterized protein n=1 Tax=Auricularia subglabra (strain TFB-10046 / SS5) TaxID=717982 RepID=J0WIS7_AURST|nr:hypothetical protein AURDEDRAFT_178786 [Auricularia subglabra TFB-10046 SS5]
MPYYVDVGAYLFQMLQKHIQAGKGKLFNGVPPKELATALRVQLPAYARQEFPFNRDSTGGWRAYWSNLSHHQDASVLAFLAVKLLSMLPNSMAEERTMSAFTNAQDSRPGLKIRSLVAEVQVKQHYAREERLKTPPVKAPDLVRFRELAARVRSEAMSSAEDRFSHPKATGTNEGEQENTVPASDGQGVPFGTEFNEVEAHDVPDRDAATGSTFSVAQSVDLKSVLLRDLLSDSPLAEATSGAKVPMTTGATKKSGSAQDFVLDAADFSFDL